MIKSLKYSIKIGHLFCVLFLFLIVCESCSTGSPKKTINSADGETLSFFLIADIGSNGYFHQKEVAEQMGSISESIKPAFIILAGDCFPENGIRSITDPLWFSDFENIYLHPGLYCDWYPVLGSNEYRGNTQAVIDYGKISRRWNMPSYYYTSVKRINDTCYLRLVFIDTTPFIENYRNDSLNYHDVRIHNYLKQVVWIDSVLSSSVEKWKIVIGHHPVFTADKEYKYTGELSEILNPVFKKNRIDAYISGSIHNFQHLKIPGLDTEYLIAASGSLGKPCLLNDSTLFTSQDEGFVICSVSEHNMVFRMVSLTGETTYQYTRSRQ